MSVSNYLLSGIKFNKAKKLSANARLEQGEKADQLFQEAYENFASISNTRVQYPDALHAWGLALFNQAQKKTADEAIKILEQAISKFNLCGEVTASHLGAALDGGVALMALAKAKGLSLDDDTYGKANELLLRAEEIQQGAAAYNLACLYALQNNSDACHEALEKARDSGLVPDEQEILQDLDLENVKNLPWFDEFIASLAFEQEPEEPAIDPYKKTPKQPAEASKLKGDESDKE